MLKVEHISKSYGNHLAVDDLSFVVNDGEIFGLLGENGAGKTTTFRIIMGLLDANIGKVSLNGKPIDYLITNEIGFVTEERSLLSKLTVREQLIFYGTLKGLEEDEILKKMDMWLEKFQITEYKNRKIKELSKGNQQKIQFISAVFHEPKLLILDEPFTGLDPINVKMMKDAIYELQKKGCSIIFSSHQMEHIEEFCEKLVILVKGKSILSGYVKDIKKAYQKMNIRLRGDIDIEKVKTVSGVLDVSNLVDGYLVKIEKESIAPLVFDAVKNSKVLTFDLQEATLNEIFIEKVGGAHVS